MTSRDESSSLRSNPLSGGDGNPRAGGTLRALPVTCGKPGPPVDRGRHRVEASTPRPRDVLTRTAVLAIAVLAGCADESPVVPAPADGPPPTMWGGPLTPFPSELKNIPEDCLHGTFHWYVTSRSGWLVYNVLRGNRCDDQPLRLKVAVRIYGSLREGVNFPRRLVGTNRHERIFQGNGVWICGDGWLRTACSLPVRYPGPPPEYGNLNHTIDTNYQVCFPEEPCPWPDYPEIR